MTHIDRLFYEPGQQWVYRPDPAITTDILAAVRSTTYRPNRRNLHSQPRHFTAGILAAVRAFTRCPPPHVHSHVHRMSTASRRMSALMSAASRRSLLARSRIVFHRVSVPLRLCPCT